MAAIPLLHRHQPSVLRGAEHAEDCLLLLDSLSVPCSGLKLLPELYLVPEEEMVAEQARPCSVDRMPAGRMPFKWAQLLLVVASCYWLWPGYGRRTS